MRTTRTKSAKSRLNRTALLRKIPARRRRRAAFVLYPRKARWDVTFSRLEPARFVARPNRFRIVAAGEAGILGVACADPGRLLELLLPGAALRLLPAPLAGKRRTTHTAVLVRHRLLWVPLVPVLANRVLGAAIEAGRVPGLAGARIVAREHTLGHSRFDFVLRWRGRDVITEVKAASLVVGRAAVFPDAPTERGTRHVRELAALSRAGRSTAVIFIVQRPDADFLIPNEAMDPAFAAALRDAHHAGVRLLAFTCRVSLAGCRLERAIPVKVYGRSISRR